MKKIPFLCLLLITGIFATAQGLVKEADSLKKSGLLMPALEKYGQAFFADPSDREVSYKIASTCSLLWTEYMRDTAFFFLNHSLEGDASLKALHDPHFLSLIDDPRWSCIVDNQIKKYETENGNIKNEPFAKALFKMIIRDQGFQYAGNIERRKYIQNGGYFDTPSIFPVLAMEEQFMKQNIRELQELLDQYGWPTASEITEIAAAGAALIINHSSFELRKKYFPLLKEAFEKGEAQPLRFAKMQDRLLVEEGKEQLYGTQIKFENLTKSPHPIMDPEYVDKRRIEIGLGPLAPYLKARFDIDWSVVQKE
ncbi:MAG: hypothetical protein RIM99_11505 [Cyclobacteriaceae bacterium]